MTRNLPTVEIDPAEPMHQLAAYTALSWFVPEDGMQAFVETVVKFGADEVAAGFSEGWKDVLPDGKGRNLVLAAGRAIETVQAIGESKE
ncbi:MAG: hypothetical protein ACYC4U_10285 [Pirellulaceae bacterium]